jgi:hypothetical protein
MGRAGRHSFGEIAINQLIYKKNRLTFAESGSIESLNGGTMKKFRVRVCVFLFLGFLSVSLFGYEYVMKDNLLHWSFGYHTGSTKVTALTGGSWDDGYYDLVVPAANQFYYYGRNVTHIRIYTNGYVEFGFGSAPTEGAALSATIPSPGAPNGIVAPFLDDLDLTTTGEIYYDFNAWGTVIEWRNVPAYGYAGTSYSFSISIYPHTHGNLPDLIHFQYSNVASGNASHDYGAGATVGIEHPTGTQGELYSYNTASLTNGKNIVIYPFVPVYGGTYNIYGTSNVPVMTVWRPSNGYWFYRLPNGTSAATAYGTKGDIPLPGDWNGDGNAEACVLRPNTYQWFCANPAFVISYGSDGDIPVPADYDGAGQLDIAVFRPGAAPGPSGAWFIYHRHSGVSQAILWGMQGDIPMPADYDGDGKADLAVYRPANNTWFIRKSSNPATSWVINYGADGDIPMAASWAGTSVISIFRPSSGYWFYLNPSNGSYLMHQWGADGDEPVPCDQDLASGSETIVFRPQSGLWFIDWAVSFVYPQVTAWGTLGDKPRFRRSFGIIAPPGNTSK